MVNQETVELIRRFFKRPRHMCVRWYLEGCEKSNFTEAKLFQDPPGSRLFIPRKLRLTGLVRYVSEETGLGFHYGGDLGRNANYARFWLGDQDYTVRVIWCPEKGQSVMMLPEEPRAEEWITWYSPEEVTAAFPGEGEP